MRGIKVLTKGSVASEQILCIIFQKHPESTGAQQVSLLLLFVWGFFLDLVNYALKPEFYSLAMKKKKVINFESMQESNPVN